MLSMVTLGLTALTPVLLIALLFPLSRRLTLMQKDIADVKNRIAALNAKFAVAQVANLKSALELVGIDP